MATNIGIKYTIDTADLQKARGIFDNLSQEEKEALEVLKKYNKELDETGKKANKAGGGLDGLFGKIGGLGPMIAGAFSVAAITGFAKAIFDVTGRFESLGAVLKNTLGSDSAALGAMIRIKEIASTTPFSVEELTASFVKLANQGFKPTNAQIIALGDLASSTGKSFDMLAEALIDAQVGEFERLKEFGVRASKQGDQVKFTFKGVETTVKNTSTAIQDYIVSLGNIEGVAGAMQSQSETLNGAISNLGDAWDGFLVSIGERLGPIYKSAIQATAAFLTTLKDLFQSEESKLLERQGKAYNTYTQKFTTASDAALKNIETNSAARLAVEAEETKRLEQELQNRRKAAEEIRADIVGGGSVAGMGGASVYDPEKTQEVERAAAALAAQKKREADYKAMNQAAIDELIKRSDARKKADAEAAASSAAAAAAADKAAKKAEAALKKEYKAAEDAILLQQKITEERIKQTTAPEGQALAIKELQMATNLELLQLAKDFEAKKLDEAANAAKLLPAIIATQNKEIADQYAKDDKASAEQRLKDYNTMFKLMYDSEMDSIDKRQAAAATALIESGLSEEELQRKLIENEIAFNQERIQLNKDYSTLQIEGVKTDNDKLLEENARKNRELKKQEEAAKKERLEITLAAIDATAKITNQAFQLYQANLSAELSAVGARYEEEIRLAEGNQQKVDELNAKRKAEEAAIRKKQFQAQRMQAIAEVIFNTAPIIANYLSGIVTAPLAAIAIAAQAAQIGFILAQPVPEFAQGTKGKKFKGGRAIVGELGTERIVTESGKVYYTPPTATLVDLPKGSQVIPNHLLSREEIAFATMTRGRGDMRPDQIGGKLNEIGNILKGLPIHQITMDEKGFQKFIKTERKTTKVLNNKFPNAYS